MTKTQMRKMDVTKSELTDDEIMEVVNYINETYKGNSRYQIFLIKSFLLGWLKVSDIVI